MMIKKKKSQRGGSVDGFVCVIEYVSAGEKKHRHVTAAGGKRSFLQVYSDLTASNSPIPRLIKAFSVFFLQNLI